MRSLPVRGVRCFAVITVALQVAAGAAAHAQTTVGGHIGIGIPWVTWAGGPPALPYTTASGLRKQPDEQKLGR
jgi:hypothetical protein